MTKVKTMPLEDNGWTDWIPVDSDEFRFREDEQQLPVPPWMMVKVRSTVGVYPDVEQARFFSWEYIHGDQSLIFYKVRLH